MRSYPTTDEAYLDLLPGRIDAVLVDTIHGQDWLASDPAHAALAPVGGDIYNTECFAAGTNVGLRQDEPDLLAAIIATTRKIPEDGSGVELSNRYLGRDICGQ